MIVIHVLAIIGILIFGGNWQDMIVTSKGFMSETLKTYGYSLVVVYLVWIGVVLFLYPFCKKYMMYKHAHKEKMNFHQMEFLLFLLILTQLKNIQW